MPLAKHPARPELRGRRVTVMGLGRHDGGTSAVRWLSQQGARVTVTDLAERVELAESLARLSDLPKLTFELGHHRAQDFRRADLVVVNPAVRPENPFVEIARNAGVTLSSETELFLGSCPAPVIGVTGSNGKSTTAAMIAAILRADQRRTWLGGNIGRSLLSDLEQIRSDDIVVLELSSFQLFHLSPAARFPEVAVVTNCRANHLDWHPDFDHYVRAKQRLIVKQAPEGVAILNSSAPELRSWRRLAGGRLRHESSDDQIPPLQVAGKHNRANAACAAASAATVGCSREAIEQGLRQFSGLPHRMRLAAEVSGRRPYDDSAATTPESTACALRSLEEPVWLLAGGASKGADFAELARVVVARARGAAFYGQDRAKLYDRVATVAPKSFAFCTVEHLDEAADWCFDRSKPGEAILLSPACSSLDQFRDYQERGRRFTRLAATLGNARTEIAHRTRGRATLGDFASTGAQRR